MSNKYEKLEELIADKIFEHEIFANLQIFECSTDLYMFAEACIKQMDINYNSQEDLTDNLIQGISQDVSFFDVLDIVHYNQDQDWFWKHLDKLETKHEIFSANEYVLTTIFENICKEKDVLELFEEYRSEVEPNHESDISII